jgi:hypothetical protein
MIRFSRVLPFDEYLAANRIANLHSTRWRRVQYIAFMKVLPALAIILVPLGAWLAINAWREPGNHAESFGLNLALAAYGAVLLYCPLSFRRRVRKQYQRQGFHEHWLVEISPSDVHSAIAGQVDSRLEWGYFNSCIETPKLFVLIRHATGTFLSLPKTSLSADEQAELRAIIASHLPVTAA